MAPTTTKRRAHVFRKAQHGDPAFEVQLLDCTQYVAVGRYKLRSDRSWKWWSAQVDSSNLPLWHFDRHPALHRRAIGSAAESLVKTYCPWNHKAIAERVDAWERADPPEW